MISAVGLLSSAKKRKIGNKFIKFFDISLFELQNDRLGYDRFLDMSYHNLLVCRCHIISSKQIIRKQIIIWGPLCSTNQELKGL